MTEKNEINSGKESVRTIELFAGTGSFSRTLKRDAGVEVFRVERSPIEGYPVELVGDIRETPSIFLPRPCDILWASPPCEGFSVAAIGKHWTKDEWGAAIPKHPTAELGVELLQHTFRIIRDVQPTWWFIENPRGMMRKVFDIHALHPITGLPKLDERPHILSEQYWRNTVTYCQYGDTRMKPTDIWTNAWWWKPKEPCKNGMPCHEAAPRGSRTGTQGIKEVHKRSMIPEALFIELYDQWEEATCVS